MSNLVGRASKHLDYLVKIADMLNNGRQANSADMDRCEITSI